MKKSIKKVKLNIAGLFEKEAEVKKVSSHLTTHISEMAIRELIEIGGQSQKIDELKVKMAEANKIGIKTEMKAMETTIELPLEYFQQILKDYSDKSFEQILEILAKDSQILPSFDKSKKDCGKYCEGVDCL